MLARFCITLILASCSAFAAKPEPAPRLPLRDFFKNPEVTGFQISPDGNSLAYLKPWEKRLNVFVRARDGKEEKQLTQVKDRDIASFVWKNSDTILYTRDFGGDENFHVFAVSTKGGSEKELTPYPGVRAEIIDDLEESSADEVLLSNNRRDNRAFDVYRVNIKTGQEKLVGINTGSIVQWVVDHKGRVRAAISTDGSNNKLLYRDDEKQSFKTLKNLSFKETFSPWMFTADDKRIYVNSNLGRDNLSLVEYDPKSDKEIHILAQHPEYDLDEPIYSKKRKTVVGVAVTTTKPDYMFFEPEAEHIHRRLQELVGDVNIVYASHDKAEENFVIRTSSDRSLGAFYLYDVRADKLTELAKLAPQLPEEQLAAMRPIQYQSRDGLTIHGYLVLPKGVPAKNLPLVVHPHGGPWARDVWRYSADVQFLANRGYAVLMMNFRGSTGYGRKFWEASFKQWGKKMQNDVTDGASWLIEQGIANPKKVAIYGGSYGGYATLAGLAFTPNVYAAGVDYVGVSNLFTFMRTIPPYWKPMLDQFHEMVGDPDKDKDQFEATSPALHVNQIKAPLFVAQGAKDPRVNKNESDQVVNALRKRGVDVEYMVKDDEGHGFHNEENKIDFYEAMEKFLDQHVGPRG